MGIQKFFRNTKNNAYATWFLTSIVGIVLIESILDADFQWIIFTSTIITVVLIPAIIHRNWQITIPWEVLMIAVMPVIVRALEISALTNQITTYLSIAALALIITVQLHIYTEIKFSDLFAIIFTVTLTMAIGAIWSVLRFLMDTHLGTNYLTTNEALMEEYINITIAGIIAGFLFDSYFKRRDRGFRRRIKKKVTNK